MPSGTLLGTTVDSKRHVSCILRWVGMLTELGQIETKDL